MGEDHVITAESVPAETADTVHLEVASQQVPATGGDVEEMTQGKEDEGAVPGP